MTDRRTDSDIDEYIAAFPTEARERLEALRALIRASAPGAVETISYGMPTFDMHGKHLVHYAGYAHHIGVYPTPSGIEAFKDELAHYKNAKGSVQFPLDKPFPIDLIRRMVEFRVAESDRRAAKKVARPEKE